MGTKSWIEAFTSPDCLINRSFQLFARHLKSLTCEAFQCKQFNTGRQFLIERTVLDSAHWEGVHAISKIRAGFENADTVKVSIPLSVSSDSVFIKPKSFDKLADKEGHFTFRNDDKICKGVIPDDVSFEDLEKEYDDVVNITAVDTADYGSSNMHHWELMAK